MDITPEVKQRIEALSEKYAVMGQNINSYLDGLLYADYLTYWDYIHLDTLLSLQNPRTPIPDERIFILYHQITELYFKLILDALETLCSHEIVDVDYFNKYVLRANRYMEHLISSFDVMIDGMDPEQFLMFRMSLLPASGFQSVQYRLIELISTDVSQLVHQSKRDKLRPDSHIDEMLDDLYWRFGAIEVASNKKTLTLEQFELKYKGTISNYANKYKSSNVRRLYQGLTHQTEETKDLLRRFDFNSNVLWPLSHYKSAARYLEIKPNVIKATGGTNWQDYLPPKNQLIYFYPELWSEEEKAKWGVKVKDFLV